MISVFEFENYRVFLNSWIEKQNIKGCKSQMAKAAGVSSTLISLILKGDKHLSSEQSLDLCEFMGFNDKECDYFMLLVELGRSGSHKLTQRLKGKIKAAQKESQQISKRVKKDLELSEESKALYYSSWVYTGIRNLAALEKFNDAGAIAQRLNLPTGTVIRCLDFLVDEGLCLYKNEKLTYGAAYTHINNDSPFVNKHHQNWRFKSIQQMDQKLDSDLFYTCPMSLSLEATQQVRELLLKVIQEALKVVGPSPSEEVRCLNIDWFSY